MAPNVKFDCDTLVLIHNDDTIRQVKDLLLNNGSVDIYVDHKIDEDVVVEGVNKVIEDKSANVDVPTVVFGLETKEVCGPSVVDEVVCEAGFEEDTFFDGDVELLLLKKLKMLFSGQKMEKKQVEVNEDSEDDFIEEDIVNQTAEKIEGNDSEYIDSSDPKEYTNSGDSSYTCGVYFGIRTVGPRYNPIVTSQNGNLI
ncbi:hypothetical protein F3Y22_tig00117048pilonHSYRG00923 [Hibiscus syriacus]|uniref:Uncharacterized protein n=1 Tax=Hibiscus syriacus TaxID=106335 RepID=A0A6A2WM41_HIBSY|nr:hypothetical protein F3Y22_tig00117048pilonHSYRG00923 [Hibiscus syriacus]